MRSHALCCHTCYDEAVVEAATCGSMAKHAILTSAKANAIFSVTPAEATVVA
jgi:hypothetical protein